MSDRATISVLIDTYNHEEYVEQAIGSVLEQVGLDSSVDIVVVDDGSTDGTADVVRQFAPRVHYVYKTNGGQASAFNVGIASTRGSIVAFLDGDDWWAPHKLTTIRDAFARHPEVSAVGHAIVQVYEDGRRSELSPGGMYRLNLGDIAGAHTFRNLKCFLGTSRLAMRRTALDRILPVPESLVFEADEFLFTLVAASDVLVLNYALTFYRLHAGNLYQFHSYDAGKLRRKATVLEALVRELPIGLEKLGVASDVIAAVVEPVWVEAKRLRLSVDGGSHRETFAVERAAANLGSQNLSFARRWFRSLAQALALVLPPRTYYSLRHWYSRARFFL